LGKGDLPKKPKKKMVTGNSLEIRRLKMEEKISIKGKVLDKKNRPVADLNVKVYDDKGRFLAGAFTSKKGFINFECGSVPKNVKFIRNEKIIDILDLHDIKILEGIFEWDHRLPCFIPPAEWRIKGIVKDKMSGSPLQGLTVEVWDVDESPSSGPYYDSLGEDITDAAGEFNVWFDGSVFEREAGWTGEQMPDVLIKVKNSQGVVIHETEVDQNVSGSPYNCGSYCTHKGKEYVIEIDYVTVAINMVGPVPAADINASGRASYGGINDRPFGGNTTIGGRIWGAKVEKWKLYHAQGFIDSNDTRFNGLGPNSSDPSGFSMVAEGTSKVWDGPICKWSTSGLEETHTVILVVWDKDGNEYHDTQILFLHNTAITPPAQISIPAPGSALSKGAGDAVEIQGTASDDYFRAYALLWVGPTQTELTNAGISYPAAGNYVPVVNGKLGEWDISNLPEGPYCVRLSVSNRSRLYGK
jgi:hypothetical protein